MWQLRRDNNMISNKSKRNNQKKMYKNLINTKLIPTVIIKPEQGGKGVEFTKIIDNILENKEKHLCIFISPNRKASGDQTLENFTKYFERYEVHGSNQRLQLRGTQSKKKKKNFGEPPR